MENALPAHCFWMYQHVGVGEKAVGNMARLPGVGVCVYGHVDHHRSADEVLPGNTTPEAAVVGISPIVAQRKITIVGNAVREGDIYPTTLRVSGRRRFGGTCGVVLFKLLSIDPNIPVT